MKELISFGVILSVFSLSAYNAGIDTEKMRNKTVLTWENPPSLVKVHGNKICYGWPVKNCSRPHNVYECHFVD